MVVEAKEIQYIRVFEKKFWTYNLLRAKLLQLQAYGFFRPLRQSCAFVEQGLSTLGQLSATPIFQLAHLDVEFPLQLVFQID